MNLKIHEKPKLKHALFWNGVGAIIWTLFCVYVGGFLGYALTNFSFYTALVFCYLLNNTYDFSIHLYRKHVRRNYVHRAWKTNNVLGNWHYHHDVQMNWYGEFYGTIQGHPATGRFDKMDMRIIKPIWRLYNAKNS
jgi:hypothetical protein